jgi:surfactin synthase thioesterase subunit
VRILCFPYAGGTAAFTHNWSKMLPEYVELLGVQYPAPEIIEPQLRTPQIIVDRIYREIHEQMDLPVLFFGYSLGATIAYETCHRLSLEGLNAPSTLIVAAARAPHLLRKRTNISDLSDTEFIAKLRSYGGTPESVLTDKALMDHFLPYLRADFATGEQYQFSQSAPLLCPITAIGGSSDRMVDHAAIADWKLHTSTSFNLYQLEGGHFFLNERPHSVISIVRDLAEQLVSPEPNRVYSVT